MGRPTPLLSVCIALKNRSRVAHDSQTLELFPNVVRSLITAAEEIGPIELVVADFESDDWPLEQWLDSEGNLFVTVLRVEDSFSRGRGLNKAAEQATSSRLFLTDADVTIGSGALQRGIDSLKNSVMRFPVCVRLDQQGGHERWEEHGFGLVFVTKDAHQRVGGVPEFQSWGGEDDLFFERISRFWSIDRTLDHDLMHQWHPSSIRSQYYKNAKAKDIQEYRSQPGKADVDVITLAASHAAWGDVSNTLRLFRNGRMLRHGVDRGDYRFEGDTLVLLWDRWPEERLQWTDDRQRFENHRIPFFLSFHDSADLLTLIEWCR